MKRSIEEVVLVAYVICVYFGLPVAIIAGWIHWAKRRGSVTLLSLFSVVAFGLATCSALIALSSLVYAHRIGGFPFYDPRLMRIYRWGGWLSLVAVVLGLIGCWRRGPLRWYAPICAAGMLIFWGWSAMGE
jgi:uncharacterized BrkB/YihY/UPF0761 family membrane protein